VTTAQLHLDFTPGLTAQFKTLSQVCAAAVYASRGGLSGVAGDLDIAPSDLCRRLQDGGDRPLSAEQLDGIIASTKDYRPIYWLIEKFLQDPEAKRLQAIHQLSQVMPLVQALVEQAAPGKVASIRR
jgi:hypothetical protein